jgi:single-stranded DNA-binding protein
MLHENKVRLEGRVIPRHKIGIFGESELNYITLAVNRDETDDNWFGFADFLTCRLTAEDTDDMARVENRSPLIRIFGRVRTETYTDKNNVLQFRTFIDCQRVKYLSERKELRNAS